ncbi:MAG: hypothetical protein V7K88_16745 [Nostoc sp.]|uniref:hypothetical protein n=1 Tax=Nostoc sp. TaxID=1180 RepID=UPI002FFB77AE
MSLTIDDLEKFENYLYNSSETKKYINTLSQEEINSFNKGITEFSHYVNTLRTHQIELVIKKLEQASKDLLDGIDKIKKQIASLKSLATTINIFSELFRVLEGVVSSVLPLP